MSFGFWRKIRQWVQRKEAQAFLEKTCVNLKCPHCNTWASAAEGEGRLFEFGHPIACAYKCGQCERDSAWVCEAGFWFPAEEFLGHEVEIKLSEVKP